MTQNTVHFLLFCPLAKLYLGGVQNVNISFVSELQPYWNPKTMHR